jgi:hypothetical protein
MLVLISAAFACGPYGNFQNFQPEEDLHVSVMTGTISVYDQEDDTFLSQELRATHVRRVDVVGDQLVVFGNRGVEFVDLTGLST